MRKNKAKKKQDPNDLDLHGVKHQDAEILIEEHVLLHAPPFRIVTGHSLIMKKICRGVLDKHDYKYSDGSLHNLGCISVHS